MYFNILVFIFFHLIAFSFLSFICIFFSFCLLPSASIYQVSVARARNNVGAKRGRMLCIVCVYVCVYMCAGMCVGMYVGVFVCLALQVAGRRPGEGGGGACAGRQCEGQD